MPGSIAIAGPWMWRLAMVMMSVWLGAAAFHLLRIIADVEEARPFTLVTLRTLGYANMVLPLDWRILGGPAAGNGLLSFDVMTAMRIEPLRHVSKRRIEFTEG